METMDPLALIPEHHRRLTVREYHQMIDAGVFEEGERVELLEGVLVDMTPQSGPHAFVIEVLNTLLVRGIGPDLRVRVQLPLTVSDRSEPEPDLAVVPARSSASDHPTTALLVVEVARGSLKRDRAIKVPLYARANVGEYWIVDVDAAQVEIFRDPDPKAGRYRSSHTVGREDQLEATTLPGLSVSVGALFPR